MNYKTFTSDTFLPRTLGTSESSVPREETGWRREGPYPRAECEGVNTTNLTVWLSRYPGKWPTEDSETNGVHDSCRTVGPVLGNRQRSDRSQPCPPGTFPSRRPPHREGHPLVLYRLFLWRWSHLSLVPSFLLEKMKIMEGIVKKELITDM